MSINIISQNIPIVKQTNSYMYLCKIVHDLPQKIGPLAELGPTSPRWQAMPKRQFQPAEILDTRWAPIDAPLLTTNRNANLALEFGWHDVDTTTRPNDPSFIKVPGCFQSRVLDLIFTEQ